MTPEAILDVMQRGTWVAIECATPLLAVGAVVGLVMGLVQAATQISEPALTFVPKMLALAGSMLWFGSWILERLTSVSREFFSAIANLPNFP